VSLTAAFQIGRSGLNAAQVGIQVTGNNLANAATPGYTRQQVFLNPAAEYRLGNLMLGRGVEVAGVRRMVDGALQDRLMKGTADDAGAQTNLRLLSGVEATLNELSDQNLDLSSQLTGFFNAWSELANTPNQASARALVVQKGQSLAAFMRSMQQSLVEQRTAVDTELRQTISNADDLLTQVARLNTQIVTAEQGGSASGNEGAAAGLRDQRDQMLSRLAELMDVSTIEQPSGAVDVLVGSTPVVLAGISRGVQLVTQVVDGETQVHLATKDKNEKLNLTSGQIGALLGRREDLVNDTLNTLDTLAQRLIYEVNRVHSTGSGLTPYTALTATTRIPAGSESLALNDPTNAAMADLPFKPTSGSFLLNITDTTTNSTQTVQINVDLDGLTSANTPGFTDDTSLLTLASSIATALGSRGSVGIDAQGRLGINAASGYKLSFSQDSSGVLAALGLNSYFTGTGASDIDVRSDLLSAPGLLAVAQTSGGTTTDNAAALAVSAIRNKTLSELGGNSLTQYWEQAAQAVGVRTDSAKTAAGAASAVKSNLEAQRSAISGVSTDEEAINLINYQRLYEANARFISTVNELTQILINLAR
jgi:flagellar hook-associated protein 1 FlgK